MEVNPRNSFGLTQYMFFDTVSSGEDQTTSTMPIAVAAPEQLRALLALQNADGGWPYRSGGSWTEPTVYAVMACLAAGETAAARSGIAWVLRNRQVDGGWPSRPGVPGSSWTTGLVALLPPANVGAAAHAGAIHWLLETQGEETSFFYKLRLRMLGEKIAPEQDHPGWPWLPGASAWVGPTVAAMLALDKEAKMNPSRHVEDRLSEGRSFLLSRACQEGGWNHGGNNALGYPAEPYPETTGMGLLAMRGVASPTVEKALDLAERFLETARTADAQNWLRLGLAAHHRLPDAYAPPPNIVYRTAPEMALHVLADSSLRGEEIYLV